MNNNMGGDNGNPNNYTDPNNTLGYVNKMTNKILTVTLIIVIISVVVPLLAVGYFFYKMDIFNLGNNITEQIKFTSTTETSIPQEEIEELKKLKEDLEKNK